MSSLRPNTNKGHDLGSSSKQWNQLHVDDVKARIATFSSDVTIQGNLTVEGSQVSLTELIVDDPLFKVGNGNTADTVDLGFYGEYDAGGGARFAGIARDASDGSFKVFADEVTEPGTTFAGSATGHIEAASFTGPLVGNADTASEWANARTVSFATGDVHGSFSIQGGADVSDVDLTIQPLSVEDSMLAGSISDGKLSQDYIQVTEVDDSSIEWSGTALNVKALGVTNAMLAGSIENAKLSNSSVSLGGVSVSLGGSVAQPAFDLTNATALPTASLTGTVSDAQLTEDYIQTSEVDDSSIEFAGGTLNVKALGVTNAMLAGSIENAKLSNSTVSFGGVSVALGSSDATPAFDLSDATNLPTTSLTGTVSDAQLAQDYIQTSEVDDSSIEFAGGTLNVKALGVTNAMLAGSIENAKLSNNTVSFGGVQLALGGSDASPAFDLSDATNYPTAQLVGDVADSQLAQDYVQITEVDNASIEWDGVGGHLQVKALGVTNAMLAGSIENAKLVNDSVSLGGVSVDLGASVAQPAFDLTNATNYPALSLTGQVSDTQLALDYIQVTEVDDSSIEWSGTALNVKALGVTNAMLAGSIENAKLSNSTVSYGGVQLSLGGSDATPAFDLSDATNYPTTSLVGTITNDQLAGSIANSKLVNSSISFTDGTATSIRSLGDTIQINGTSNEVTVELDAGTNAFTIGLPDTISAALSGNASTATNLQTARDFSISSSEITASAVSFNGGANVQLVPSIVPGSIANSKLANSSITVADVSGNSEAISLGDTLYIGGTSSEIDVTYNTTLNKFTIGLPNNVVVSTNLECGGALSVGGNITATGNISASGLTATGANITFADTLLEVGLNNTDLKDIGFYGQRGDGLGGSNGFAGFVYDESQDRFMTFKASTEPTTTVGSHTLAELQVRGLNVNNEYDLPVADGTDGQVLTTDGNGNVTFENIPAQNTYPHLLVNNGSVPIGLADQSGSYSEQIVLYNGSSADQATVTLTTDPTNAFRVTIKNYDSVNILKYQRGGTNTIEGSTASENLLSGESITLMFRNGIWYKIGRFH